MHYSHYLHYFPPSGGFPQYFRVRLQRPATTSYLFVDVFPHNASAFTVPELAMDTAYSFAVMAFNKLGESGYSGEVRGATASKCQATPHYLTVLHSTSLYLTVPHSTSLYLTVPPVTSSL